MTPSRLLLQSTSQQVKDLSSQVTHPIWEYDEARINRLLAACDENRRHTFPDELEFN